MLGVLTAVNAQTYVCDLADWNEEMVCIIPGDFTNSGHPFIFHVTGSGDGLCNCSIYQSDFTTQVTTINNFSDVESWYIDYDNLSEEYYMPITQTLFNNDAYFEYFDVERDENDYITAINVKSTNGSTIWTYRRPEGMLTCRLYYIFKLDNKYYMSIYTYNENYEYQNPLFLIKQNQGITEINNALPISAFPTTTQFSGWDGDRTLAFL